MKHRKKLTAIGMAAIFAVSASACGSSEGNTQNQKKTEANAEDTTENASIHADNSTEAAGSDVNRNHILIAYFTAAENSGVDAEASASYSVINGEAKGRIRAIADMIQENTGGDLFSVQTDVVYPADGGELIEYAQEEQDDDARPELTVQIENFENYDTIFVGFPTWWYDMPQAMYSFFDTYDFSGKTLVPFNVHNGSRFSGTIETIEELEPNATVVADGFTVNERDVPDAAGDVADWVRELGY